MLTPKWENFHHPSILALVWKNIPPSKITAESAVFYMKMRKSATLYTLCCWCVWRGRASCGGSAGGSGIINAQRRAPDEMEKYNGSLMNVVNMFERTRCAGCVGGGSFMSAQCGTPCGGKKWMIRAQNLMKKFKLTTSAQQLMETKKWLLSLQ